MNFLKKFATFALKAINAVLNVEQLPIIQQITPAPVKQIVDRLKEAVKILITAEQMFAAAYGPDAKKGSDKLKAATPYVAALVGEVVQELKPGAKPKDEAKFEAAIAQMTSGLADALSSYGD